MYSCLSEYCKYFNESRPHQGIGQKVPLGTHFSPEADGERLVSIPILGGLVKALGPNTDITRPGKVGTFNECHG